MQQRQTLFHFRAGAKRADFHQRHRPPGQLRDFFHRFFLDFQKLDDHSRRRRKLRIGFVAAFLQPVDVPVVDPEPLAVRRAAIIGAAITILLPMLCA